ncbi:MAG: repair protein RadC [Clostridia bacterium]|jgi:DNA repair protein RadC|nr:radC [Clostridiales bacterium]MDK2984466.1 repair protein RadC [Clostridia bacterium]
MSNSPHYHLTIKELPKDMRPRERMISNGPSALSNSELLAILLRTGNAGETAMDLASRILSSSGGLKQMAAISMEELSKFKGIGIAKAAQIIAAIELGRRIASTSEEARPKISCPEDVANLLLEEMRHLDREHFRCLSLNTKNYLLAIDSISIGSLNSSIVHPREVFKKAVIRSAAGVILVHNHPSGDPTPSGEDISVTKRLVHAGETLGIDVLDHLIIGDKRYISLKEKGII